MAKKRILIVDDERDVAKLLRAYLENDYDVEEAHNGSDALNRIFKGEFDLILLDYAMKDIKGDRICQLTRTDDQTHKLPVIIVTAHVEVDEKQFREYGASDVLYKPVNNRDLLDKIEKYLSKKH